MPKITLIGGGSYTWAPTFLRDIFTTPELRGSTVVLEDINPERMGLIYQFGQKMLADYHLDDRLEQTSSLDQALENADFIILTITTGGLDAMRADLEIPARYGIRQSVGDTSGPGGLSRALRNIPVVAEMAARIDRICPDAIVLNYTNPLTVLTRALAMHRSAQARTIGMCHEWYYVRGRLAALLGVEKSQIQTRVAGINHLIWMTELYLGGRNGWEDLRCLVEKILSGEIDADPSDNSVFADKAKVKARLFQLYGALPVAGDRHIAEFFPHFINEATHWGADWDIQLTDVEYRQSTESAAYSRIMSMLAEKKQLDRFMHTRSIEAAADIIAAVTSGNRYYGLLNLPNAGQIDNLPEDAILETHGMVDRTGAHAMTFGDLPSGIQTVLEQHIRNQEMTVQAALKGDRCLALQVLLNDPLSSRLTIAQAENMLSDLLSANREFLPQFH